MTDGPLAPTDFAASADDELVFDDIVPAAPSKKPRRAPARNRDAAVELPPSAAPDASAAAEPTDPPVPVPQPGGASAGSILSEQRPRDRGRIVLLAIVGLALFTSLMSLGGLIAVSRTLAAAQSQREEGRGDRDALARLPEMIAALDRVDARLAAAPARTGDAPAVPVPAIPPLTSDDFHHGLDALRLSLDARQPAGASAVGDTLHAGFAEMGVRLDRIEARLARPASARTAAPR